MSTYLATVLPGLEFVAEEEVRARVSKAHVLPAGRGKVFWRCDLPVERLLALRTVDNLYCLVVRFPVGPHRADLAALEREVARAPVAEAAAGLTARRARRPTFYVNASRSGRQTYSRFEAAEAAARGVARAVATWRLGTAGAHDVELRLDVEGEQATLAVRLTPPSFRFRGAERAFAQAALRPTVAHALVWLSEPRESDRFVDPFGGSGTIGAERAAYPARRLLVGDLSAQAVEAASSNLPPPAVVMRWDARHLPLREGAVDAVVTNLPFGRQILSEREIGALYRDFARELRRLLAPGGRAILLSDQLADLHRALGGAGLDGEDLAALSLKGLHPHVVRVRR